MMNTRAIEVGVYGGCVQWVRGVPKGVDVKVNDYDIDGVDEDIIGMDADGHRCITVIYEGGEDDFDLQRLLR